MDVQQLLDQIVLWLSEFGIKLIAALAILFFGRIVVKLIRKFIVKMLNMRKVDQTIISFTSSLVYSLLWVFVILAALANLGVETTSAMAILGAAGLAIGLALQGSLSNFAAGFLLIILHPFKVGDYVDIAGVMGKVDKIGILTTDMLTFDNKREIIPNSLIMSKVIVNYTTEQRRRVDLTIGVSYSSDIKQVKEIIEGIIKRHDKILAEPAYIVRLANMNDSSLDFAVKAWVETADYWTVFFDLNEEIKEALDEAGISIPFPQMDVHMIPAKPVKE
ncbi:MAG: mechanosensitive ion channel [Candidatus Cloacimonadales bacterium]